MYPNIIRSFDFPLIAQAIDDLCATILPAESPLQWDAAQKSPRVGISGDGQTAMYAYDVDDEVGGGFVRASRSHQSGRYYIDLKPTFQGPFSAYEVMCGLCDAAFDATSPSPNFVQGIQFNMDGSYGSNNTGESGGTDEPHQIPAGDFQRICVDFDAGEIRRSPTDPVLVHFPPGTALWPYGFLGPQTDCAAALEIQARTEMVGDYRPW